MDLPTLPTYLFEPNLVGLLSLFLTILLPVLVGLLVRPSTPKHLKSLGLLGLASVKSVVEAYLASDGGFDLTRTVYTVLINFGIAVVVHYGLLKPTGVSQAAQNTNLLGK